MDTLSYRVADFEGPLDLLLHLINRNKLDINDIPIHELVEQYCEQIKIMRENDMDVTSEFLDMAARLVYIKTVSLLPKQEEAAELKRELQGELIEYRDCQLMAEKLSEIANGFGFYSRKPAAPTRNMLYRNRHEPSVLVKAYLDASGSMRGKTRPSPSVFSGIVEKRIVPVAMKIISVMRRLWNGASVPFKNLFYTSKSRSEMIATFLAVLELVKAKRVIIGEADGEQTVTIVKDIREESDVIDE